MAFEIDIGYHSLAGTKPENEDFCAAMLPEAGKEGFGAICAIADGVSAGGCGKEAAQTTVMSLVQDYFCTSEAWDTTVALDRILMAHNAWLCGINQKRATSQQCGLTTLTALVLRGQSFTVAHVGDSRAYLLRAGHLTQLTSDHVVAHLDFQHQLLRSVGADAHLMVDYVQSELQVGDVFILTTDGVHGSLNLKQLCLFSQEESAGAASKMIVNAALDRGSQDNASAIVVRIKGLEQSALQSMEKLAQKQRIPSKLRIGQSFEKLSVTGLVSETDVNLLYQMRDQQSSKLYALKTLHPSRANDAQERHMLVHEAWLAKRMQSGFAKEHFVQLNDAPQSDYFYLLYDWHSGKTLEQLIAQAQSEKTPISLNQALQIAQQALKALGAMHRQSVIHRDIKPANLHWGADGVLRILDLGAALSGHEPEAMRELHAGTPSYMNPEQFGYRLQGDQSPQNADSRSDLYALGVTLYQLLTGKLPYGEVLPYQTGRYFADPAAPSRHNAQTPKWLDHVLLKATARDEKLRFETAEEFLLTIERGAARPLSALPATPLLKRSNASLWKIATFVSLLFNLLLVIWLLFLPTK